MKTPAIALAATLALGIGLAAQRGGSPASPPSLVVRDVTLIDGTGTPPHPGMSLRIRDGRIESVSAAAAEGPPDADLVLNAHGLVAIPGLIDAHVHLSPTPWAEITRLRQVLRGGVTAVYDLAGDARNTGDLARAELAGEIEAPTIYYLALMAGPAFFSDPRVVEASLGFKPGSAPWNQEITAGTDMVRAVASARGTGANGLKLYAALDAADVGRIAPEAKRQGMRLVAHGAVFPARPSDLVAAGVNMLAHAAYLVWEGSAPSVEFQKRGRGNFAGVPVNSTPIHALLQSMAAKGVALNPTLWIFANGPGPKDELSAARAAWGNAVTKRAQELGVTIAAGTDAMMAPDAALPALHDEMQTMVSGAGLTPMQALVAATGGAARAMGVDAIRGTLQAGKAADLVLLDANPLDDIRATRRIRYVIKDGRIVR